jgi:hypothetical protein
VAAARRGGLGRLSDYELCGLLHAARRLSSWQAELELAAVTELATRRTAPDRGPPDRGPPGPDGHRAGRGGRGGDHVADEVAALLRLTGRAAGDLVELARQLVRLPQTAGLLAAGIIDRDRAGAIAGQLALLSDDDAAAVDAVIAPRAGEMTTGRLRSTRPWPTTPPPASAAAAKQRKTPGSRSGPNPPAPPRWPAGTWPRPG